MELGLGLSKLLVLPLYLAGLAAIVLTICYRIEVGLFFLIPFLPNQNILNYINDLPFGKDMNDLLIMAMLFRWVIDKGKANENLFINTPLNLPVFLLLFWTFIEIWWGAKYFGDPLNFSLENSRVVYWKNLIRIPLLYLIVANNIKDPIHKKAIVLLMVLSVLMLDRGFYSIAMWRDLSHYRDTLKYGGTGQALGGNALAVCLAMNVIVMVSLFLNARDLKIKLFLTGPILLTYYCILFLFSRSGYLAAFVGFAIVGIMKDKKIIFALIVLGIAWESLLPVAVKERIEMTKVEEEYDGTVQQRFEMWELGRDIVISSPIFGAGIDAAQHMNITIESFNGKTWHSFHNAYLQQAVETGLVGLAIYLWIYLLMIISGWRLYRRSDDWFQKALGLGLLSSVMACLAGNIAGVYWNYIGVVGYMYILAGLVMQELISIDAKMDSSTSAVESDQKNFNKGLSDSGLNKLIS
jgi:O-antigen ligase